MNKKNVILAIILSFMFLFPIVHAAFPTPRDWDEGQSGEGGSGDPVADFTNGMGQVFIYMFGEVDDPNVGFTRFAIFIILLSLSLFVLLKIFGKGDDYYSGSSSGKAVAGIVALIISYAGARGMPEKTVVSWAHQVGSVASIVTNLMMPGLVYIFGYFVYKVFSSHPTLQRLTVGFTLILGGALLFVASWGMWI